MTATAVVRDQVPDHRNAFDLLRLLAAVTVVADHAQALTGRGDLLPGASGTTLGLVAVGVFFLLSGYLVAGSWLADPSVRRFAARRLLRIYPAYAAVILLLTFVIAPLTTRMSPRAYFTGSPTWSYLADNLQIMPMQYMLPGGGFTPTAYGNKADGSLWSIRVELMCYVGVVILGLLTILKRRWLLAALAVIALVVATAVHVTGYVGVLVPHLLGQDAAEPIAYFCLGMAYRAFAKDTAPPWWLLLGTAGLWAAAWGTPLADLGAIAFVTVLTFTVAFTAPTWLRRPTGSYDLSYGIYLFGFPAQQLMYLAGVRTPILNALAALAVTLPVAALSWRWLESQALRLKPGRRAPRPAPTEPATVS